MHTRSCASLGVTNRSSHSPTHPRPVFWSLVSSLIPHESECQWPFGAEIQSVASWRLFLAAGAVGGTVPDSAKVPTPAL